jgi:PAS domain S-box-containing protein
MTHTLRTSGERRARSGAVRDLVVVSFAAAVLFATGLWLDVWDRIHGWLQRRAPGLEFEIYAFFIVFAAALAVIAIRRWRQATREAGLRDEVDRRFRALVEEVPAITYTWDPTKPTGTANFPYVSPQVEAVLGYTPQEFMSSPTFWIERIHPDDRDRVVEASNLADRTGKPFHDEYRAHRKDGEIVWLRDESVVVARDAAGRPLRSQGVMFDITSEKQTEERLQEAENRYRTIVERVPAVAYVWDSADAPGTTTAAYISPQIQDLLGYSVDEWRDDPDKWNERAHPDDAPAVLEAWDRSVRERASFSAEYRMLAADGRLVWVRDEAVPVSAGPRGKPIYQGVMFDITEQKLVEDRLRQAEERNRALIEQLPVVVYMSDATRSAEGVVERYVSPGIEQLTGYSQEEWIADREIWLRCLHPEDRDAVIAESDRTDEVSDPFDMEYRIIRKNGAVRWIHDTAVIVNRGPSGKESAWQGLFQDVTEQRHAAERLSAAEQRFRALVEQIPAVTYLEAPSDGAQLYISPQVESMFGFTQQEWLADPARTP